MRFFFITKWRQWETPNIWVTCLFGWTFGVAIGPFQFGVDVVD